MDSTIPKHKQIPANASGRKFLGKTENFKDNRERHFYQRMLKHYLKGHTHFNFGFDNIGNPEKHLVLQEYSY